MTEGRIYPVEPDPVQTPAGEPSQPPEEGGGA